MSLTFPIEVHHPRRNRWDAMEQARKGVEARLRSELAQVDAAQITINIPNDDFRGPYDE